MIMITNNTYDTLENLLLGDGNFVKINNVAPKTSDKVPVTFHVNEFDHSIDMTFTRSIYDGEIGMPVNKSKMFKLKSEENMSTKDTIDFIIGEMLDKLNESYGIPPFNITRFKNSNCLEF